MNSNRYETSRILLAGKSNGFIKLAKKFLEKEGYHAITAFSVKKIYSEIQKNTCHVIIPDSFELSGDIQNITKKVLSCRQSHQRFFPKILLLIDIEDRALYSRAIDWGVDSFFNKNQDIRLLLLQIRNLTEIPVYKNSPQTESDMKRAEKILSTVKKNFESLNRRQNPAGPEAKKLVDKIVSGQKFFLEQAQRSGSDKNFEALRYCLSETEKLLQLLLKNELSEKEPLLPEQDLAPYSHRP